MSDILLTPMSGDCGTATAAHPRVFTGSFTAEEMSLCYVVVEIESVSAGIGALTPATITWETSLNHGVSWRAVDGVTVEPITAAGQFTAKLTGNTTLVGPICRVTVTPPAGESLVITSVTKSRVTDLVVFRSIAGGGGGGVTGDIVNVTGAAQYASAANVAAQSVVATLVGFDGAAQREVLVTSSGAVKVENVDTNTIETKRIDYTTDPVTTLAWTQLWAVTSAEIAFMDIFDSSGETMEIGVGAAGAEVQLGYVIPGGNRLYEIIPAGSRVALRAVSADATIGEFTTNAFG